MTESSPTVSVILPTYNRAHLIGRAIQSVLSQTYQDFELIIVDDGSTDNTKEIVKSFNNVRIKYIKHAKNKGGSAARNTGIRAARGEYIAFQDSDDEWLPEKLEKQTAILINASPKVGIVYSDMWRIAEKRKSYWHSPTITYGILINPRTSDYQVMNIGIQSTLIKRECFDKVGFFDEELPRFIDLELFIRLLKQYHFLHIKEPMVKYYATGGISSNFAALSTARKLLLENYFEDIKDDRKFLANQYFYIGIGLCSAGELKQGKSYFLKAIKTYPLSISLDIKTLLATSASLLGQSSYNKALKAYVKIRQR